MSNDIRYLFLDLETTGLGDDDQITEAAWILSDTPDLAHHFVVSHSKVPNNWVLQETDYITRILLAPSKVSVNAVLDALRAAYKFDGITYLVGANPSFDDRFIRRAFNGESPPYHYHLIDVEALVMGRLNLPKPPRLKECRELLGMSGQNDAPHTALADAREVKLIFDFLQRTGKSR